MIATLSTTRNGPNPVPQDVRTHSLCSSRGADVMATQSRGGGHRSECFQTRCIKSAVRLERRGEAGHEGLRAIDTAYRSDGERWRARHPEMQIRRSWLLRARFERASRCDLQYPR